MNKSIKIFESKDEITAYNPKTRQYLVYIGFLTIKKGTKISVKLVIKDFFIDIPIPFEDEKTFSGESVSDVYGKLSKWLNSYGLILSK